MYRNFHNLSEHGYHHLMLVFGNYKKQGLKCVATDSERYISVSLNRLRFIDSLRFISESLENLVSNMSCYKFIIFQQFYTSEFYLMLSKGIYSYDFLTKESKFSESVTRRRTLLFQRSHRIEYT